MSKLSTLDIKFSNTYEVCFNENGEVIDCENPFYAMPEFPGGIYAMRDYINNHLRYPSIMAKQGIQERVDIGFIVGTDGKVYNPIPMRGKNGILLAEAIRVVKKLPDFIPSFKYGKPIKAIYSVPVNFQLK